MTPIQRSLRIFLLLFFLTFLNAHAHASLSHTAPDELFHSEQLSSRASILSSTAGQNDYTCGPNKPCSNGACCGPSGWCGYEPKYCGKGCQSNCDAKAECGKYAATPGQTCPLNVCCSEFGFCGTTLEFCGAGCQSKCQQPKPSVSPSNSQKRIVGYWETWNSDHPCGKMSLGAIPVEMLTHLNIAFGYINSNFHITNMDGVPGDLYKNVGNLKAKNSNLKILIALGGWTFSDPGPWQDVFPRLTSTKANRAVFIENLLSFLGEFGYDGVDFDWEYPGAGDRGGSAADGANYVALVKELREAITASGYPYLITFTAPTSYWYLRHFDLKNMEPHIDWINLMAYDLHGVWDSKNPIGSQVLAHTNLTEIDAALDLFWREGIKPSSIVLGLGFYGRTFQLTSSSCWKPGCSFNGPGKAGPCTETAGILSYREIQNILKSTGATSYHDKKAAVRYLVYSGDNWISYDDAVTFQAKIDYANKMGLSGLMVWAVDQDDNEFSALWAVSGGKTWNSNEDFDLVSLDKIFPSQYLPEKTSKPSYGLVTFGAGSESGDLDPNNSGFGFLLVAGDSHGLTQLKKRDGAPEPFIFLDCPDGVTDRPANETQTARVVCMSEDIDGCFQVMERGVEGTIVEMPDNCAPNSFARAISLTRSTDQTFPEHLSKRDATSDVFDFTFDFNRMEVRADTTYSVRMDVTNVKEYWDSIVDSAGVQRRSLEGRYFSSQNADWKERFNDGKLFNYNQSTPLKIKASLDAPLFWQGVDQCLIDGQNYGEGIGAFVKGDLNAEMFYGVSMVATYESGELQTHELNGFIKAPGQTDATYGVGGLGIIDIAQAEYGNPAWSRGDNRQLDGSSISAGPLFGFVSINPYYSVDYSVATYNGTERFISADSKAPFDGRMSCRVVSDFGHIQAVFPNPDLTVGSQDDQRKPNEIQVMSDDVIYGTSMAGGTISITTDVKFGISMSLTTSRLSRNTRKLPTIELHSMTMAQFAVSPGDGDQEGMSCASYDVLTTMFQSEKDEESAGWEDKGEGDLVYDRQTPGHGRVCHVNSMRKRDNKQLQADFSSESEPIFSKPEGSTTLAERGSKRPFGLVPGGKADPNQMLSNGADLFMGRADRVEFDCPGEDCMRCLDGSRGDQCCGCVCMECEWGTSDIEVAPNYDITPGSTKRDITVSGENGEIYELAKRPSGQATLLPKRVRVFDAEYAAPNAWNYPAFPQDASWPWDGIENGRWYSISRYWGPASDECTDWSIIRNDTADQIIDGGASKRAAYETEHVLEGQLLGDFFEDWLVDGKAKGDTTSTAGPKIKVDEEWVTDYILQKNNLVSSSILNPVTNKPEEVTFLQQCLMELGNQQRLNRLTILRQRINSKKGALFAGNRATNIDKYKLMGDDEQLQSVKELGLIFSYLNNGTVWSKFCDTYEDIRNQMILFDTLYQHNQDDEPAPLLQTEWQKFVRRSLDLVVARALSNYDEMFKLRKSRGQKNKFEAMWAYDNVNNRKLIKLDGVCTHLPKTT